MPAPGPESQSRGVHAASVQTVGAGEFTDVAQVLSRFAEAGYLADNRLATTMFLQSRLGKPVLLEGPAGVGKTQLASTLAEVTGRRLLRLQCYEGQDETKALYEWDYGKQLLYTQLLRDKIGEVISDAPTIAAAVARIGEQDSVFFSETFLASRPLLEAIRSPEPVVLLIDEIDRADEALEAVLLEMLAEFQVSVPEIGTFRALHQPYVILTSNSTRDLSAALKRRCLHLFIDYPDPERELAIVRSKNTGLPEALARRLVDVVRGLRGLELRKSPSISETVDWARTLAVLGVEELTAQVLSDTANVVLKYQRDLQRALEVLPRMLDPNIDLPDRGHGHGHGHGHDHDHGPGDGHGGKGQHDRDTAGPDGAVGADGRADGPAVRAAKDQPGRHDQAYYGSPTAGTGGLDRRPVGSGQGGRAFAAALGRGRGRGRDQKK
jgi:MoxR-like ATPase